MNYEYPDLAIALYQAHNLDEARHLYIGMLRATGKIIDTQYAAKLDQSRQMLKPSHLKQLERDFSRFRDHLRNWSKKTRIQVSIKRRQKDFLGVNSKIRLYLDTGKNLSTINDLIGFRIILQTDLPDNQTSINHCYAALNETINFFCTKRHYMLIEAEPRSGEEISNDESKKLGIYIPKKSLTLHGFENNVKDYVCHPKKNGYQSLHILVSDPATSLVFEVQIRTSKMDIVAEYGSGEHSGYKAERYQNSDLGNIDFTKIRMPGFFALPSGEIYDSIGLQKSIDPFNLLR